MWFLPQRGLSSPRSDGPSEPSTVCGLEMTPRPKMQFQRPYRSRILRFLLVAFLIMSGTIFEAICVVGSSAHEPDIIPALLNRLGSEIDRARVEPYTLPQASTGSFQDSLKSQQVKEERLARQLRPVDRNRNPSLSSQQPRLPSLRNRPRPAPVLADARINQEQLRGVYQRVAQLAPQSELSLRNAFDAHLQQALIQARHDGARLERERLEQLERIRAASQQRPGQESHRGNTLQREAAQRDKVESPLWEAGVSEGERSDRLRLELDEQEKTLRMKEKFERERLEQQRLERQRAEQQQQAGERLERVRQETKRLSHESQEQQTWDREREAVERDRLARERLEKELVELRIREKARDARAHAERMRIQEEQELSPTAEEEARLEKREQERLERQMLLNMQAEAETAKRTRAERERTQQEEQELARIAKEKQEKETLEKEKLERQMLLNLQKEKERAERTRAEHARLQKEKQELERITKEKEEKEKVDRQMLLNLQREAEKAERTRAEHARIQNERHELARSAKEKEETEKREKEKLDRQMLLNLQREAEKAERTRTEHRRRESEKQELELARIARQKLEKARLQKEALEKKREQEANGNLTYASLEAEMLEEMKKKKNRLQSQALQQNPATPLTRPKRGAVKPVPREAFDENIGEDIDRLWDTFQSLVRYTRARQAPQVSAVQSTDGQNREDYREPLLRPQERAGLQTGGSVPKRPNVQPEEQSAAGVIRANSSPTSAAHDYRNSNVTVILPQGMYSPMDAREHVSDEIRRIGSVSAGVLYGNETESVVVGKSAGYNEANEEVLPLGLLGNLHLEAAHGVLPTEAFLPTAHPEATPEKVSRVETEVDRPASQYRRRGVIPVSPDALAEPLNSGETESPLPSFLPPRRLEAVEGSYSEISSGSAGVTDRQETAPSATSFSGIHPTQPNNNSKALRGVVAGRNVHVETSTDTLGFLPLSFNDDSDSEHRHLEEHNGLQEQTGHGTSASLRELPGLRNRTKYRNTSADPDAEGSEETTFPVVQLDTSSSRPPPVGPQVAWTGAVTGRGSGRSTSSGRYVTSDGSDYPNTPYRTYMYYTNPFSSPYSTHSYREDYGTRYSNRYYHDISPKAVLSWKEYVRRREEKKLLETLREEEEKLPTVGVIESHYEAQVGILEPVERTNTYRPPSATSQRSRTSLRQPEPAPEPVQRRPASNSRTRISFTPYSSIAAARTTGGPLL